jgi:hypothetical protein
MHWAAWPLCFVARRRRWITGMLMVSGPWRARPLGSESGLGRHLGLVGGLSGSDIGGHAKAGDVLVMGALNHADGAGRWRGDLSVRVGLSVFVAEMQATRSACSHPVFGMVGNHTCKLASRLD